ncbi:hypothetical protein MBOT_01490 [Mycobacterium botniense]|uniref:Uncharacterized protein n=1 Tax=Mycobacterium botniense TaxID=84962 RepID=A0A7I9XS69_9MYCO|nr:hypothetical protein MBOT_01490 [Mycobacterium botniense]
MQGLADQLVGDIRPVKLRGVDVVDAELDRPPQHRQRFVSIPRRPERSRPGKLDSPEADARDGDRTE